jgi:hypothetical protein
LVALEVKSGRARSLSGLEKFRKKFPTDRVLLVGGTGLPWEEFLHINPKEFF